jgi:hypothetical protein
MKNKRIAMLWAYPHTYAPHQYVFREPKDGNAHILQTQHVGQAAMARISSHLSWDEEPKISEPKNPILALEKAHCVVLEHEAVILFQK